MGHKKGQPSEEVHCPFQEHTIIGEVCKLSDECPWHIKQPEKKHVCGLVLTAEEYLRFSLGSK